MLDTSLYSYLESIAMILFMERDKSECLIGIISKYSWKTSLHPRLAGTGDW